MQISSYECIPPYFLFTFWTKILLYRTMFVVFSLSLSLCPLNLAIWPIECLTVSRKLVRSNCCFVFGVLLLFLQNVCPFQGNQFRIIIPNDKRKSWKEKNNSKRKKPKLANWYTHEDRFWFYFTVLIHFHIDIKYICTVELSFVYDVTWEMSVVSSEQHWINTF